MTIAPRLLLPAALVLLGACAQQPPSSVTVQEKQLGSCPLQLHTGQTLTISLPSNPTTGYRWAVVDAAPSVLRSLGPEVYSPKQSGEVVGSGGESTWRYRVLQAGSGRLLMHYQQPWQTDVAPAQSIDCQLVVQ
ncbi:protease inhibitor I42 family protein [Aquipseudomonas campi]